MRTGILILILLSAAFASAEPTPKSVLSNRDGIAALKKNSPMQAQEKFIQGLSSTPFEAKLHLNLGLTFQTLGQPDKAQASYENALKFSEDDETRFTANFNMGEMQQKAKNKDEALRFYQEALKYNPDSEETKVNIELLTQDDQGGGGKGENQDKKDQKDQKDPKDKDGKGDKGEKDQKQDQKDQEKEYAKSKPQPQKFKSEELTQGDVNKILGEIKQQEQKIRADFNKREVKEQPKDQDW